MSDPTPNPHTEYLAVSNYLDAMYKCPKCGGLLNYTSTGNLLICDGYGGCGYEKSANIKHESNRKTATAYRQWNPKVRAK